MIPYGRQHIDHEDIAAVVQALQSDWLTQGPMIEQFEQAIAKQVQAKYAVSTCNATAALHVACRALGLGHGDRLWTSPNTFLASANCALFCGAQVDFVDIDPRTYNLCPIALEEKLKQAEKQGALPKIIMPVHFAGQSCDMEKIFQLAKRYHCFVLEDASHAIGADYHETKVGSCKYSDISVFSFHPVKIMTTGEGGVAVTNQIHLYEKMKSLRSHGMTKNQDEMDKSPEGNWYYQQIDLGYNYRLTDLQAALGLTQLNKLEKFIHRRRFLAKRYHEKLADLPIQLPLQHHLDQSSWHLYVIQVADRSSIFKQLREAGIGVQVHYIPVHTQPYYQKMGFKHGDFPHAEQYYAQAITLPLYYDLTNEDQDFVIHTLKKICVKTTGGDR
ncbi:MAG: UDP-4-amino-4,6-dideoxy-N-acetyl-beta-L-altrosamine transaminase [Gammaproteobacteria bacterium RIFCSPHIGHO2_12_FULL_38_11]|nr:MAG: UDP-4-amino-4,6-dideoxy-N-acetyl-beta-L-altrosamine transaminase [Gammaproteobacteria bacterium RIFCSPHIGHO2_12_FULL_38_11]